jgi:ElaB/YqjD/DUF883 family membrane-anchored ribosome-binding protein
MNETNRGVGSGSSTTGNAQGSGSDTVSAAKISAGTSVGTVGQSPKPQDTFGSSGQGTGGTQRSSSTSNTGQSAAGSAQGAADTVRQGVENMRDQAGESLGQASEWARNQYEQGSRQLDQARDRSMQQLRQARGGIERYVSENPLMVGVVGLAAGLVIGALLPRTRHEDRAFGHWADEVRDQGLRYAREATQRGREYVEEALGGDSEDSEDEWRPDEDRGGVRSSGPRYQNH